jgi:hypothetical protein
MLKSEKKVNDPGSQVKLNPLKHHLGFLKARMECWKEMEWEEVREEILELGNNQFDMYKGYLTVRQICEEADQHIRISGIHNREELQKWLGRIAYRSVLLSDGSKWIIRESDSPALPAHIHPARYQECVIRVRSTHLKTAVALIYENRKCRPAVPDPGTGFVNRVRTEKLSLSPVRSVNDSRRILETLRFLSQDF